jgi:hypothetical protein
VLGDPLQGFEVVVRHAREALHQRLEAGLYLAITGGAQGGERAAVKTAVGHHHRRHADAAPVAVFAGNLDRRLVGLGAGVAEERFLEA